MMLIRFAGIGFATYRRKDNGSLETERANASISNAASMFISWGLMELGAGTAG
jgi:hypothetical protein